MIWLGLIIGFCIVGPIACWLTGVFNPIGYLGVPPWRVPRCPDCGGKGTNELHKLECTANR